MLVVGEFGGGLFEILFFLFVFAAILFLAYITTKVVAKKSGIRAKSKYMEIVDRLDFGADKQLYILKAGDEHFLLSKSSKGLEVLTKVSLGNLEMEMETELEAAQGGGKRDFKSILEKHLNFGAIKVGSEKSAFRRNISKIRGLSENSTQTGVGEGENTDRET